MLKTYFVPDSEQREVVHAYASRVRVRMEQTEFELEKTLVGGLSCI